MSGTSAWVLKGEGNANIVFGYQGDDPQLTGRVLRVRKVRDKDAAIPRDAATDALEALVWQDAFNFSADTVQRQVNYEQQHLRRYLNGYVPRGQLVPIPPPVLEELSERGKGCDPHAPALLLPDHTQLPEPLPPSYTKVGPCVCVEIKPKSGHVSSSPYISRENDIKRHVPRYQMHMLMKHMKGKVAAITHYNPLDLFSGCATRMAAALEALLAVPHNNLKLFVDGALVYGGKKEHAPTKAGNKGGKKHKAGSPAQAPAPQQADAPSSSGTSIAAADSDSSAAAACNGTLDRPCCAQEETQGGQGTVLAGAAAATLPCGSSSCSSCSSAHRRHGPSRLGPAAGSPAAALPPAPPPAALAPAAPAVSTALAATELAALQLVRSVSYVPPRHPPAAAEADPAAAAAAAAPVASALCLQLPQLVALLAGVLQREPLLPMLASVQQLDVCDVEAVYHLYKHWQARVAEGLEEQGEQGEQEQGEQEQGEQQAQGELAGCPAGGTCCADAEEHCSCGRAGAQGSSNEAQAPLPAAPAAPASASDTALPAPPAPIAVSAPPGKHSGSRHPAQPASAPAHHASLALHQQQHHQQHHHHFPSAPTSPAQPGSPCSPLRPRALALLNAAEMALVSSPPGSPVRHEGPGPGGGGQGQEGGGLQEQRSTDSNGVFALHLPSANAAVQQQLLALPQQEALPLLRDYLTAATAKDCGIMITLQRVAHDGSMQQEQRQQQQQQQQQGALPNGSAAEPAAAGSAAHSPATSGGRPGLLLEPSTGHLYAFKAAFVDLDLKPLVKLPAHFILDHRIVSCAKAHPEVLRQMLGPDWPL